MAQRPDWVPEGVDIDVPNASRVYDFALGGVHNFGVDRELWQRALAIVPDAGMLAQANRAFLGRAVEWLTESGISQFLDLGSGIPTLGNVHEVAQQINPDARVLYVDVDPVAVEQSNSLLQGNRNVKAILGDLRDPHALLADPRLLEFLDFSQPVAVLMVAVLHFITDGEDPAWIVEQIGAAVNPGSILVISHVGPDVTEEGRQRQETVRQLYEKTPTPVAIRTPEQIAGLLGESFELLDPGVVSAGQWRPDSDEEDEHPQPTALVAVGRRR
ncbi:SAM-dependent methyltransferase [Actinoplanes sp. NPDC051343]|uniref:SAM-dependent methyltransferase n=1 Tax=Actinoplanes sp. NPDC051343 TaxID=3363906 RepID=UPI0037AEDDAB